MDVLCTNSDCPSQPSPSRHATVTMDLVTDSVAGLHRDHAIYSEATSIATTGGHRRHQKALSNLDVLRARQINRITRINLTVVVLGLAWSILHLVWAYTVAFEPFIGETTDGRKVPISNHKRSILISFVDGGASMMQVLVAMVIAPVYFLRVFRNNEMAVTSDQVMVGIQHVMTLISNNPAYTVVSL